MMPKFRKKPIVIEATQWFKNGDHDAVSEVTRPGAHCHHCKATRVGHGKMVDGRIVCPGDWIIGGEPKPCKPDIFEATYERVEEPYGI